VSRHCGALSAGRTDGSDGTGIIPPGRFQRQPRLLEKAPDSRPDRL